MVDHLPVHRLRLSGSDLENSHYLLERGEALLAQVKFKEAIESYEQAFRLKKRIFGEKHRDTKKCCKEVMKKVVESLKLTYSVTDPTSLILHLHQLEKAASLLDQSILSSELCELYNTLSCAYRQLTNFPLAKKFIEKALTLSQIHPEAEQHQASLCLSMCVVLAAMNDHQSALEYAKRSALLSESSPSSDESISLLSVAYHNIAVQEECFHNYSKALVYYRKAVRVLEERGGDKHMGALGDMRKSLQDAVNAYTRKPSRRKTTKPQSLVITASAGRSNSPKHQTVIDSDRVLSQPGHPRISSSLSSNAKSFSKPQSSKQTSQFRSLFEAKRPSTVMSKYEKVRKKEAGKSFRARKNTQFSTDTLPGRDPPIRSLNASPRLPTTTDEDLCELESKGLLEYTLENAEEQYEISKKEVTKTLRKRLRGNMRVCASSRIQSGAWGRLDFGHGVTRSEVNTRRDDGEGRRGISPEPLLLPIALELENMDLSWYPQPHISSITPVPSVATSIRPPSPSMPEIPADDYTTEVIKPKTNRILTIDAGMESYAEQQSKDEVESRPPIDRKTTITDPSHRENDLISAGKDESLRKTIDKITVSVTAIQAFARGINARKVFNLMRNRSKNREKLLFRTAKRLKNRQFAIVMVFEDNIQLRTVVTIPGMEKPIIELSEPKSELTTREYLLKKADLYTENRPFNIDSEVISNQTTPQIDSKPLLSQSESFLPLSHPLDIPRKLSVLSYSSSHVFTPISLSPPLSPAASVHGPQPKPTYPFHISIVHQDFQRSDSGLTDEKCSMRFLEKQTTKASFRELSDAKLSFRLVYQKEICGASSGSYTVLVYENAKNLLIKAVPQHKAHKVPTNLLISKGKTYWADSVLYCESLVDHLRVSDEGDITMQLVSENEESSVWGVKGAEVGGRERRVAAVRLQAWARMTLARRRFRERKRWAEGKKSILFRGFRSLTSVKTLIFAIQIAAFDQLLTITAHSVTSTDAYSLILTQQQVVDLELKSSSSIYSDLYQRLYIARGSMTVIPGDHELARVATKIQKWVRGNAGRVVARNLKAKIERRLGLIKKKVVCAEEFYVSLYELEGRVQIEVFKLLSKFRLKYHQNSICYSDQELAEMYGYIPSHEVILEDVFFNSNHVCIRPRNRLLAETSGETISQKFCTEQKNATERPMEARSVIRTSRKLDTRMWVVTMSLLSDSRRRPKPSDLIEFKSFCAGSQAPLTVQTLLQTLIDKVKLPIAALIPIGTITIQKMLKVKDGELVLDFEAEVPDVNKLATLIQAYVRGFITRRRIGPIRKGSLITCQVVLFDEVPWVLYAYREPFLIRVDAVKRRSKEAITERLLDTIFMKFPPTLSNKRVVENFVFPKLSVNTEGETKHLQDSKSILMDNLLAKHQEKIQVHSSSHQPHIHLKSGDAYIQSLIDDGNSRFTASLLLPIDTGQSSYRDSRFHSQDFSDFSPILYNSPPRNGGKKRKIVGKCRGKGIVPIKIEISAASSSASNQTEVQRNISSLELSTDVKPQQKLPFVSFTLPPTEPSIQSPDPPDMNLVLRSGLHLSGHDFQASVFRGSLGFLITLIDLSLKKRAQAWVEPESNVSPLTAESYSEELLSRVHVVWTAEGDLQLEVTPRPMQILYKRSHYLSERYYTITIYSVSSTTMEIQAFDPVEKAILKLRRAWKNPESKLVQKELAGIVGRLRVRMRQHREELWIEE